MSWTPSGEPGVGVDVLVLENSPKPGATYPDSNLSPHDGVDTLPASAFPEAGVYQIEVRRSFAMDLNSPSSYGSLLVVKALHRTVP